MKNQVNDPREMRLLIKQAARLGYYRLDGTPLSQTKISTVSSLIHQVLSAAEVQGLSGEDTMTILAYHALLRYENEMDKLLENIKMTTQTPMVWGEVVLGETTWSGSIVGQPEILAEQQKTNEDLRAMLDLVDQLDPLSGPNVMRHSGTRFKDNGDGTITLQRPKPYEAARPTESEKSEKTNGQPSS